MISNEYRKLIFYEAPFKIITLLGNNNKLMYKSEISSKANITFCYTVKMLRSLESIGLIEQGEKCGRTVYVRLTTEGESLYKFITKR